MVIQGQRKTGSVDARTLKWKKFSGGELPGRPVVKTPPFDVEGSGSISGRGAEIPLCLTAKIQNRKQKRYCNRFSKGLKNVHVKKNLKSNGGCPYGHNYA